MPELSSDTAVVPNLDLNKPPQGFAQSQAQSAAQLRVDHGHATNLGLGSWAQCSMRVTTAFCLGSRCESTTESDTQLNLSVGPQSQSRARLSKSGTLPAVVQQGWAMRPPPGPDEAGPSDWFKNDPHRLESPDFDRVPPELQNISTFINTRFRISPPVFVDPLNSLLQVSQRLSQVPTAQQDQELYSPTSPLDLRDISSDP